VTDTYNNRLEAKKNGNEAMSYIYQILMNSLYGRFCINPEATETVICNKEQYEALLMNDDIDFIYGNKISDHYYIVSYATSMEIWKPSRNAAVQLSAAITACSRIHMYQYSSRPDCYYTDTDSVVLGNPLPDEEVSSTELGKMKLEYKVKKGIFLAPQSYMLHTFDDQYIMKHKGAAKSFVNGLLHNMKKIDLKPQLSILSLYLELIGRTLPKRKCKST
jgi:hypothetical protein